MNSYRQEIANRAAALIVESGLSYGVAKKQAAAQMGLVGRIDWPDASQLLVAVREHIAIFCQPSQSQELAALRDLAVIWMERLASFRPTIIGAVWNGTATRHSDIHLELYCDDSKAFPVFLLNQGVRFDETSTVNARGQSIPVFVITSHSAALNQRIVLQLTVWDSDDERQRPKWIAESEPIRGTVQQLQRKRIDTTL